MAKLLYIEASPRKSRSKSIEVAHTFLSTLLSTRSSVEVDKLDLWSTELPRFDGDTLEAKYAVIHGQSHSPEQATA
jgi:FMN-dependent NADH-azoreductase